MMLDRLRRSGRREASTPAEGSTWGTKLFFSGVFLWLELVLRLAARHSLRYLPISAAFAMAAGLVCGAGLELLPGRWRRQTVCVLAGLLGLIYGGSRLQNGDAVLLSPVQHGGHGSGQRPDGLLGCGLAGDLAVSAHSGPDVPSGSPAAALRLRLFPDGERAPCRAVGLLCGAIAAHLLGVGVGICPAGGPDAEKNAVSLGDLANIEDQVEQLGLWTMLRLDVQHAIVPARNDLGRTSPAWTAWGSSPRRGRARSLSWRSRMDPPM